MSTPGELTVTSNLEWSESNNAGKDGMANPLSVCGIRHKFVERALRPESSLRRVPDKQDRVVLSTQCYTPGVVVQVLIFFAVVKTRLALMD